MKFILYMNMALFYAYRDFEKLRVTFIQTICPCRPTVQHIMIPNSTELAVADYVYMRYSHTHTNPPAHPHTHTPKHRHTHRHTYTHTYIHTHTHTHRHTHTRAHTYTRVHTPRILT